MTDLGDRFRTLDVVPRPNLWSEIETRAAAPRQSPPNTFVVVLAAAAVLVLAIIGGAISAGSRGTGRPGQTSPPGSSESPASSRNSATPRWIVTGSMLEARSQQTATLLPNGTVLVAGGLTRGVGMASAELYDPRTGLWTRTRDMITGRGQQAASLLDDGRVLVIGGINIAGDPGADIELASVEIYDPHSGSWIVTASMAQARTGGTATMLPDGRVLIAGGWGSGERFGPKLAAAELYDPLTGTWAPTASMAQSRHGHSATLLPNGKVLVAGGYDSERLASAELYDPATGRWTATGSLPEPFLGHTDTLLPNGTVLIAGGDVPSGPGALASAHAAVYDPTTGTWTATGSMITARLDPAATLLPDGRVLVLGGRVSGDPQAATSSTAELYDPDTGMWNATAAMTAARAGGTVTLLPDGRVLVAGGGIDSSTDPLVSAELFDPGARS